MHPTTVYFGDKAVCFTDRTPSEGWFTVHAEAPEEVSRAKILKILETQNSVAVVAADPAAAFSAFASDFTFVEAAGGVVVNACGEWLMIRRNGRWDLPKGHLESGERIEQCAAREVAEETGVCGVEVVRPLCRTLHAYWFPRTARWELKCTHWFEMRVGACDRTVPQTEEGIECVVWCAAGKVAELLCDAFPTIRRVAEAMKDNPLNETI